MVGEPSDTVKVFALPPLILVSALAVGFLLGIAWPLSFSVVLERPYGLSIGISFALVGFAGAMWAVREFTAARTPLDIRKPATDIVTSGPYRFSRNPIYLGMVLFMIGVGFLVDSLWFFGLAVILAVILQIGVIEPEEAYLEQKFGSKYIEYKSRVRRWI